ncbi:MAG TPA: alpha-glucan family phosphorylase [Candidatus Macondimonas sp.]|nr:alpha-glucan family phosphorylase [Candidatus Macondimonas sp.]
MSPKRFTIEVQAHLPERLRDLNVLANNLLYAWDRRVRRVFRHMDPALWDRCGHNPKVFLRLISQRRLHELLDDINFMEEYEYALNVSRHYHDQTRRLHPKLARHLDPAKDVIAYFCAEYGLHESLPIYSGGLGILAGDHCKAASDLGLPFVAVGLMYHQGYFTQIIDEHAEQRAEFHPHRLEDLPITPALGADGRPVEIEIAFPGRMVRARVWQAMVGHLKLYLLDTDVAENRDDDRSITYQLYGGDRITRLSQEIVLGIGGVRALRALGIAPTVWHINEGHAAFLVLERCRELVANGLPFTTALEQVASATLFTTHTPVPAGHDVFDRALIEPYLGEMTRSLDITMEDLLALGRSPGVESGFNMTALGLRGSRFHNGVSRIHGEVASRMEAYHWPQIPPEENPIGYVTNGVHVMTFLASEWVMFFDSRSRGWREYMTDKRFWQDYVQSIPDQAFWSLRQNIKAGLLDHVREALCRQYRRNHVGEAHIQRMLTHLSPNGNPPLVIGFARRFATYKRATLLFRDPVRLARILNQADRPIVLLFAGKAHPQDRPGQDLIRVIGDYAEQPEFEDKLFFIENYDLALGRKLVSGVDVWLNTPEYPMEACGTSGQKAGLNGALNVSILDGWWGETFDGTNGWGLIPQTGVDADTRDRLEAEELLDVLEHEVIPLYFARNSQGYSPGWVSRSKAAMQTILPRHSAERMLEDYIRQYYLPAINHGRQLAANGGALARELTEWKAHVRRAWNGVRMSRLDEPKTRIDVEASLDLRVRVELNGLAPEHVRLECVLGEEDAFGRFHRSTCYALQPVGTEGSATIFALQEPMTEAGLYAYEIRLFPFHPALAHPFETGCMLWL